jgi:hypothetical protein
MYDSENWTIKTKDKIRITVVVIGFMRGLVKYTRTDNKRKEVIPKYLETESILGKISKYKLIKFNMSTDVKRQTPETTDRLQITATKEPRTTFEETDFWNNEARTGQQWPGCLNVK